MVYHIGSIQHSFEQLYHYGIKGQEWGVRRFENADGTLTELGRERYKKTTKKSSKISTSAKKSSKKSVSKGSTSTKKNSKKAKSNNKKSQYKKAVIDTINETGNISINGLYQLPEDKTAEEFSTEINQVLDELSEESINDLFTAEEYDLPSLIDRELDYGEITVTPIDEVEVLTKRKKKK